MRNWALKNIGGKGLRYFWGQRVKNSWAVRILDFPESTGKSMFQLETISRCDRVSEGWWLGRTCFVFQVLVIGFFRVRNRNKWWGWTEWGICYETFIVSSPRVTSMLSDFTPYALCRMLYPFTLCLSFDLIFIVIVNVICLLIPYPELHRIYA